MAGLYPDAEPYAWGMLDVPWHLARAWPGSQVVIVDEAGHGTRDPGMGEEVVAATDRFSSQPSR